MNSSSQTDVTETDFEQSRDIQASVAAVLSESTNFVGQWNRLISTTNWDKGELIHRWRERLQRDGHAPRDCSDEVWSQMVGDITPQHVGRLRRTSERFGSTHQTYAGLYWSHFYAALDWADAEMWLEGAVQNQWSVADMRTRRWETLGLPESARPRDSEIVSAEIQEESAGLGANELPIEAARDLNFQSEPLAEGPDFGERQDGGAGLDVDSPDWLAPDQNETLPSARLFESLTNLPDDFSEAVAAFKLAIVRHKSAGWKEIDLEKVLMLLDALKQLARQS